MAITLSNGSKSPMHLSPPRCSNTASSQSSARMSTPETEMLDGSSIQTCSSGPFDSRLSFKERRRAFLESSIERAMKGAELAREEKVWIEHRKDFVEGLLDSEEARRPGMSSELAGQVAEDTERLHQIDGHLFELSIRAAIDKYRLQKIKTPLRLVQEA